MFLFRMLRHFSYVRRYQKIPYVPVEEREDPTAGMSKKERRRYLKQQKKQKKLKKETVGEDGQEPSFSARPETLTRKEKRALHKAEKRAAKQQKKAKKAEDKFLKNKKISEEEKAPIRERRKREAEERYYKAKIAEQKRKRADIQKMYLVTEILDGFICYSGEYYGAAIEIPPVEFRFFSEHRQNNAIDRCLGNVIRSIGPKYAANLVKLERPMVLDEHIEGSTTRSTP